MKELATFGGGCFWSIQYKFSKIKGVLFTSVGFSGGSVFNPDYNQVCTGKTGHAEVVQIEFDPTQISFVELLNHFFEMHDPTTPNQQGPDIGTQYRSVIFYHSDAQKNDAIKFIQQLDKTKKTFFRNIVTEVVAASEFWPASDEHQNYYCRRGF